MTTDKVKMTVVDGTWVLVIAALIAKILSAVYRVPFQSLVGNLGVYAYQQIYPIYGIGMTFALSGFPVYISKIIAEQNTFEAQKEFMKRSFKILMVAGILTFLALNVFANEIANLMQDSNLAPIVKASSWMFLFTPIISVLRGLFQGNLDLIPTAKSQVYEQVFRVGIVLLAAYIYATVHTWNFYDMATYAMFGGTVGVIAGILVTLPAWTRYKKFVKANPTTSVIEVPSYRKIAQKLFYEGGIICLYATILILFQLIDSFTIKKTLVDSGVANETAKVLKGIYDRGQPLAQMALVVSTSFATSLIPKLVKHIKEKNYEKAQKDTRRVIHLSLLISSAEVTGMIALMPFINTLLFGDASGSDVMSVYSLGILAITLININMTILQSKNYFRTLMLGLISGLLVKIIVNIPFITWWGTMGAALANLAGYIVMLIILYKGMPFSTDGKVFSKHNFAIKLLSINAAMFAFVWLFGHLMSNIEFFNSRLGDLFITFFGIIIGIVIFVVSTFATKMLSKKEWDSIPYGTKIFDTLNLIMKGIKYHEN